MAFGEYDIREVNLHLAGRRQQLQSLLEEARLYPSSDLEEEVDTYVGAYNCADELLGGAGIKGNVIKLTAIRESARSESLLNPIISRIREIAADRGIGNLMVFTKPEYKDVFQSLAFWPVGECGKAVLLESNRRGIGSYCSYLRSLAHKGSEGSAGVAVMNCNPLTKGHLYLIEEASRQVDNLYIIPVKENASLFPYSERKAMMESATAHLPNVTVCEGSNYQISSATFPRYFLKKADEASAAQVALDLDIFARHISPALGDAKRFVGTEEADLLTASYNAGMKERLGSGSVVEMSRYSDETGEAVSASRVRRAIKEGRLGEALRLTPASTHPYVLAEGAAEALRTELSLSLKPGLVCPEGNGSHTDMDMAMMLRSIGVLRKAFAKMARPDVTAEELKSGGIGCEKEMLAATGGVNTHRGALFALGLMTAAAAKVLAEKAENKEGTEKTLQDAIKVLAGGFPRPEGTHGHEAHRRYRAGGALEKALGGYAELWGEWLPYYREIKGTDFALQKLLLKIISTLDDTNLLHRGGEEGARFAKKEALALLEDFSAEGLREMCRAFEKRRLSPGGAADMLALTVFADSLTSQ